MMKSNEQMKNIMIQFMKFGLVGVSNTIISYVTYVFFLFLFESKQWFLKSDYLIAQMAGFVISVLWSFYWNNKYVFKLNEGEQRSIWKALLKTYVSYGFTGIILNNILLVLWVRVIGINKMLAPIINLIINIPINFFMNKLWAFGKKD